MYRPGGLLLLLLSEISTDNPILCSFFSGEALDNNKKLFFLSLSLFLPRIY